MSLPEVSPAFLASTISSSLAEIKNVKLAVLAGSGSYLADVGKAFTTIAQQNAGVERTVKEFSDMAANAPTLQFSEAEEMPKSSGMYAAMNKPTDSQGKV